MLKYLADIFIILNINNHLLFFNYKNRNYNAILFKMF